MKFLKENLGYKAVMGIINRHVSTEVNWQEVKYLRHSRRLEICEPLKAVEKPRATSKVAAIYLKKFS